MPDELKTLDLPFGARLRAAVQLLFEKRAVSVVPTTEWRSIYQPQSASGVMVTADTALTAAAVLAAVRILGETVASLPLITYRRRTDGGRERASDHYLYSVLHDAPNEFMSGFQFWETSMMHLCLWGNSYAEIQTDQAGRVVALWPLRPDRMQVALENGRMRYAYSTSGQSGVILPSERVLHLRILSQDGVIGTSLIGYARNAIGLALVTESYGARWFSNGARPGVILKHPGKLSNDAYKRLKETYEDRHQGLDNAQRTAILEEGMDLTTIGVPPEDSQFLETRKYQVAEIARIFRIPPHLLADLERATFSNIEQQSLEFVIYSVRPWLVRIEQEIHRALLLPSERATIYTEFLVDSLLRGDTQSRYAAYATGRQNGWLSANDVRRAENLNPIEGGDVYLMPLNMVAIGPDGLPLGGTTGAGGAPTTVRELIEGEIRSLPGETRAVSAVNRRHKLAKSYERVYRDVAGRILRREIADVTRAAKNALHIRTAEGRAQYNDWLSEFYRTHQTYIQRQMLPVALAYGDLVGQAAEDEASALLGESVDRQDTDHFTESYVESFASRHAGQSEAEIRNALDRAQEDGTDPLDALQETFDRWTESRADSIAGHETVQTGNAVAKAVFAGVGIRKLRWRTFGENCSYCGHLNDKVVDIQTYFINAGDSFQPEGAETPLIPHHHIGHPPAHQGCDCLITGAV